MAIAQRFPALFMLALTFTWSWAFFFSGIFLVEEPQALKLALFILGGFGPAVGGITTLRLQAGERVGGTPPVLPFLVGAGLAAAALACFRFDLAGVTGDTGVLDFPADTPAWAYAVMAGPVLVSGWVYASVASRNRRLRAWFYGLVPDGRTFVGALAVLLFLPMVTIGANLLADLLGQDYPAPRYLVEDPVQWVPWMVVKLFTVFMLTGGNEEHGWRGVLQPLMQRRMAPLWVALIIGVVWELWHLPIVLGGIYGDGPWYLVTLSRMTAVIPFALLLSVIYNGSRGSIFLCVLMHACINTQPGLFGGSPLALPLGIGFVLLAVIAMKHWRRERGYVPSMA